MTKLFIATLVAVGLLAMAPPAKAAESSVDQAIRGAEAIYKQVEASVIRPTLSTSGAGVKIGGVVNSGATTPLSIIGSGGVDLSSGRKRVGVDIKLGIDDPAKTSGTEWEQTQAIRNWFTQKNAQGPIQLEDGTEIYFKTFEIFKKSPENADLFNGVEWLDLGYGCGSTSWANPEPGRFLAFVSRAAAQEKKKCDGGGGAAGGEGGGDEENQVASAAGLGEHGKIEPPLTNTAGDKPSIAKDFLNLKTGLPRLLDFGIKLAMFLLFILLGAGGLKYMASFGNEEGSETAKRLMSSAVVGFALLLGTWGIMRFAFVLLGYSYGG